MQQYLDNLQNTLNRGKERPDRTGTGTIGTFGNLTRYSLKESFPAVTTKKLAWKAVTSELLWFLEGSGDERRLAELRFGKDRSELEDKSTIWTGNALSSYWSPNAKFKGDCGRIYGMQWRKWQTNRVKWVTSSESEPVYIDQVQQLVDSIKEDPYGRRHILSAWNPGELDKMALPPCHCFAQFYVNTDGTLDCLMYQRSCDMFLGVPFNIASYALLTHMIAHVCGLKVGEFIHTMGDIHIYTNHVEQVKEQLLRVPYDLPTLKPFGTHLTSLDEFTMDDFVLENYKHHENIKAPMAV